ncbi:30S ribosomal protein S18 [Candidatus Kaiserbacteria bacterium]|nr:30S ribosomal protein S18 [Candidatus Kaiserbacteria bacterium]
MNNKLPIFVDYKNVQYLKEFLTPHARMVKAKRSNIPAGHQRKIQAAIKRARFMALLPYIAR